MSAEDDKEEQQSNIVSMDDGPLIPQGPYPPMPEWRLNYFNTSPQGMVSHSTLKKKAAMVRKCRDMTKAFVRNKESCEKVMDHICKVQALYLCHHGRRDDIMQQLEDKGYAFMQLAVDSRLQKILYNEMMLFVNRTTSPWKPFDHAGGSETLALSMVNTKDLGRSSDFHTLLFGNIFWSWILDTFPYHGFCVQYLFRCKYLISL